MTRALALLVVTLAACSAVGPDRDIALPRSGVSFVSDDIRQLQNDDAANPGMLWVERGKSLWRQGAGRDNASCASCHGDAERSMRGVAARYPRYDPAVANIINVEGRINQCRVERQHAEPLRYESDELLALTAFVGNQSRGLPVQASIDGAALAHF
ncbi:MAG: sulfur oxidation c-type cytochrome SoxA, partial [Betaproteobacteria bacterium]